MDIESSLIPEKIANAFIERQHEKKLVSFRFEGEDYSVRRRMTGFGAGKVYLPILKGRKQISGIISDWYDQPDGITVISQYQQSEEDLSLPKNPKHWDIVGRAICEIVDQSKIPITWYEYGVPLNFHKKFPNEVYERLMISLLQPDNPFRNRIRAYIAEYSEGGDLGMPMQNYAVEKFFIDSSAIEL